MLWPNVPSVLTETLNRELASESEERGRHGESQRKKIKAACKAEGLGSCIFISIKNKRQDQQPPSKKGRLPLRLRGLHGLADI